MNSFSSSRISRRYRRSLSLSFRHLLLLLCMLLCTSDGSNLTRPTMDALFQTALLPLGSTMYVWGGGWNETDTGAGPEALTLGVSPRWKSFFRWQSADYDFHRTKYQIHDGLDCSGYIGWLLYNTFRTPDCNGYVFPASQAASRLAELHFGTLTVDATWLPGDLCSMPGHVWLCLGTCSDGSVLLLHSSPPGVRICGTGSRDAVASAPGVTNSVRDSTTGSGSHNSQAVLLARQIMSTCYPDWYARYPDCSVSSDYLLRSEKLRWHSWIFPDLAHWRSLSAQKVATTLFPSLQ